jgi:hypothetical protein
VYSPDILIKYGLFCLIMVLSQQQFPEERNAEKRTLGSGKNYSVATLLERTATNQTCERHRS